MKTNKLVKGVVYVSVSICMMIIFLLICLAFEVGQAEAQVPEFTQGFFTGEEYQVAYIDDMGEVKVANCRQRVPMRDRLAKFETIFPQNGEADIRELEDPCLLIEHWTLVFDHVMDGQRSYGECVAGIKEHMMRLGASCMIDDFTCWPTLQQNIDAALVVIRRDYWVPAAAFPWVRDKGYHHINFMAGIANLFELEIHVDACEFGLDYVRKL